MLIGELSKQSGLSKDTLRFYEKLGLISAQDKPAGTRIYKNFPPETVERLAMISQGKKLGFSLAEIKQLLDEWGRSALPLGEQIRTLHQKLIEVEQKIQRLSEIKTYLQTKLDLLNQRASHEGFHSFPVRTDTHQGSHASVRE